jgi:hypothetical protein
MRAERLTRILATRLGDDSVYVEPYREGVDSWVDLVTRRRAPFAVVRSSKVERRLTRYEGLVDYGRVLEKEVVVAGLLRAAGVPTPAVIAWQRTADPDREPSWMLVEFVAHQPADQLSRDCERQLGAIARRIHAIEPAGEDLRSFERIDCWRDWIRQRILARVAAAARYMPVPEEAAVERRLRAALAARPAHPRALLHLDLRGPNLAVDGGRIVSVFDLANAVVGDPYLELARIRGCGLLTPAFLEGYGSDPHLAHDRALDVYELDLAALLVVVSREEMGDERLHQEMVARTTTLLQRLQSKER